MFIITEKEHNIIIMMGKELDYMEVNGYPRLVEEDVAFPTEMVNVHEVETVPEEVEDGKYCYTEAEGFYANPDWREPNPYNVTEEVYNAIIDDYTATLIEQGLL